LFYHLAERLVRPRAAFFALVLVSAIPAFLASSFILNPEAPLAPLWVGVLITVHSMRERDEAFLPLLAGVLLGLAFLAKYTAVLLVPATFVYIAASAPTRRWLRRPSFYAGGAVALFFALPVIVWNAARGWPSIRLHLVDRAHATLPVSGENTISRLVEVASSSGSGVLQSVLRVVVGQLMAYSPFIAPLLGIALIRSVRQARGDERDLFVSAFTWPILIPLVAAMTTFKDAEQHWTMVAFIPSAIAAGRLVDEAWPGKKALRILAGAGVAVSGVLFVAANVHARTPALLRWIPRAKYDPHADMVNELLGWDQVRASIAQAASSAPGRVVVAGNHYSLCGRLLFEMADTPIVYCPTGRGSAFDFFGRREPPADATVIAVTTDIHDELPAGLGDRVCALADEVGVERGGQRVARYFIRSCPPPVSEGGTRMARLGRGSDVFPTAQ
ncbi:MAG: glycosyltransferase family 39 protein, partial [Myxococcota bacterium]|nr:glycosyltransferase family 39 protein [Myxococcota bacterium]